MHDPLRRWRTLGAKPAYAGLPTFADRPYTEDSRDLAAGDIAIVGAPTDDGVSHRPGARFGPRAIRAVSFAPGWHIQEQHAALSRLPILDYGDAAVVPGDLAATHAAIRSLIAEITAAGAMPIVLGGDHSVSEPSLAACCDAHGPLGLVHFDAHTDTGLGSRGPDHPAHDNVMRRVVEAGYVDAARYVQIGLRGFWPAPEVFAWQARGGIRSLFMRDLQRDGITRTVDRVIAGLGRGPVYLSIDVDVLDPAYAPSTGSPEPGGLTSAELLAAVRAIAAALSIVGADVVELIGTGGLDDSSAVVAERCVREIVTGIGQRSDASATLAGVSARERPGAGTRAPRSGEPRVRR